MRGLPNKKSKVLAMLLALSMLLGIVPDVFAEDQTGREVQYKITAFAGLDKEVAIQTVAIGTELEELTLPETLTADCLASEAVESDGGEAASDSELDGEKKESQEAVPVSWTAEPEYNPQAMGSYVFNATLGEGYTLSDGVTPPSITVWVMPVMSAPTGAVFTKFQLRSGSANGTLVYDFLDSAYTGNPDMSTTGSTYYLNVEFVRPAGVDAVQIRVGDVGDTASGKDPSANGVYYKSIPGGGTYTPNDTKFTDDFFSALVQYKDYADPKYGAKATTVLGDEGAYSLEFKDGVLTYKIVDSLTDDIVKFTVGFAIDEAFNDGSSEIENAIGISLGSWDGTSFTAKPDTATEDYSPTLDFNLAARSGLRAYFNGTSKTADLGGKSELLTLYPAINLNTNPQSAAMYETLTFDLIYPSNVKIDPYDISFSSTTENLKYSGESGLIECGTPVTGSTGTTTLPVTIHNGYKALSKTVTLYLYVTVPSDSGYNNGDKFKVEINNAKMIIGGKEVAITRTTAARMPTGLQ